MPYYFESFPRISYDIKKNDKLSLMTNIMVRFKIHAALNDRIAIYYDYLVEEGQRADVIADQYYGDPTLDWIIFLVNNMINPLFDWPLDQIPFRDFVTNKYKTWALAQGVHHYEKVLNAQSILFDGTNIPERTLKIDLTTYNTLTGANRKTVSNYDYEHDLNEKRRQIKILDETYVATVTAQVRSVLE